MGIDRAGEQFFTLRDTISRLRKVANLFVTGVNTIQISASNSSNKQFQTLAKYKSKECEEQIQWPCRNRVLLE